ncbi:hypothetical protein [Candidatus Nitrosacidococcus sp. I8]|uniref:chorismate transformation enzyme, FkbO/Hyg5 family n=1 Tax=Candidatus Nitrosacidococcus sp. I8 TaxID=2942908 RepID=UPI002226D033|nr:hypothetical protein [Candidatus Nitrosacidococcus sp. I8]CAH9017829.1 hypothetical protein NURINAE_00576 [Candidatus Nitrosacidococcus sp. I8]
MEVINHNKEARNTSTPSAPFEISYENPACIEDILSEQNILCIIRFGDYLTHIDDPRVITVNLPELQVPQLSTVEVWRTTQGLEAGYDKERGIWYSRTDSILFGYLQIEENNTSSLNETTYHIYRSIIECQQNLNYPYLLRTWNYLPHIHNEEEGLERYRAFCLGRHRTLETLPNFERFLVAATATGTSTGKTLVYFLAATNPGERVENPRQVSAFRYPFYYAPRSPSFSRATLKRWHSEIHFYISGTASIIGHETKHIGKPLVQLEETLNNLHALIKNANQVHQLHIKNLQELSLLKVYIRQGVEVGPIAQYLKEALGNTVPTIFLQGDICREELLVEIEAFYREQIKK